MSKTLERAIAHSRQNLGVRNDPEKKKSNMVTGKENSYPSVSVMFLTQFLLKNDTLKEEEGHVDSCLLCCAFNNI